ncbi:hypothetical protein [Sphingopyxis sp. 113P3]|uniref:hypothetical protein n=1 Tax=Sphingopyxis sp. (strain 113P3) TaxID=292913 RepID=UPI0006AD31F2|nr:hypothetical protein [Sphingopyxis sp. 113P3]ALC13433.1 hypothetical protein LH20_15860 [Sphingopyxis sp. 113P3]
MDPDPSARSVPSATAERLLFAIWGAASLGSIIIFGLMMLRHPDATRLILDFADFALIWCGLFGVAGFLLRRRRLKRVAAREKFIDSLANPP